MKIYFNRKPVSGPWGGGSKVLSSIVNESVAKGHHVFFNEELFSNNDLDILFCVDPRPSPNVSYDDLLNYKRRKISCKIVQRIGDLGTHGKPELFRLVKKTAMTSDVLVFPSQWALNMLQCHNKNMHVIPNAPLSDFVKPREPINLPLDAIKIVTHHWSDNPMKGFEVYRQLDEFCDASNGKYQLTYIGRKPDNIKFRHYQPPKDVQELVAELQKHHLYVTASKQEAGANHVLEAMGLGLPILYNNEGGSINEYCKDYGMAYETLDDLTSLLDNKLNVLLSSFHVTPYTRTSNDMAKEYVSLLESIK